MNSRNLTNHNEIQIGSTVYLKGASWEAHPRIGIVISRDMYMAEIDWTCWATFSAEHVRGVEHLKDLTTERPS
jgi:hypothetical protein